ncbi:MAG: hypothetical protein ACK53M_00615 [Betaproteobacteria bacterium]
MKPTARRAVYSVLRAVVLGAIGAIGALSALGALGAVGAVGPVGSNATGAAQAQPSLEGRSAADGRVVAEAYEMLAGVAGAQLDCRSIDRVAVVESQRHGSDADEIWMAYGCGRSAPFQIQFRPAPGGGYNFTIRRAPPGAPGGEHRKAAPGGGAAR